MSASALCMAMALGAAGQAFAADATADATADAAAAPPAPSEVTITAERRATNIQKTAVAVTAVTGAVLDQTLSVDISNLNATVPSLEITKTAASENIVTIRGVGSETPENASSTSPGVSYFIDGVYIANSISLDESLFDVDHIDVLRGPQGDLYGESSIGGAIVVNTKQPQLHNFSGQGDFSAGNYNYLRERAEINLPVGDDFAIRASIQKLDHDGWTKDTYFDNFYEDDAHDFSGKLAVLWKPTDNFTAVATGQWYRATENGPSQKNILELGPYSDVLAINPNAPAVSPLSTNPREIYQDFKGQFDLTQQLYYLNLDYDAPWFEVKSVTGYQHFFHVQREDSSRSAFEILGSYDDVPGWTDDVTNYTEEFDLVSKPGSPLDWVVGAFALNREAVSSTQEFETGSTCASDPGPVANPSELNLINNPTNPNLTSFPCNLAYGNTTTDTKQGLAGFVRLTYHVTPQLSISAGGRYNWDRSSHDSANYSEFGASSNGLGVTSSTPTGRIEADYQITPLNMIYGSVSRGYKPGGANGSPCIGDDCPQVVKATFLPETNTAYEIGSKNQFFDRTLTLNVALYYYDHYNFQYIEQDPVPFDDGMANIPHVRDYGAEFEGHYRSPDTHFHMDGSLALEKGEVVGKYLTIDSTLANQFEGPNYSGNNELANFGPCAFGGAYYAPKCWAQVESSAINIQGKSPPAMPNVSGSISASYDFDTTYGTFTPWIQFVYRGQEWARIFNVPSLDNVPSYGVLNLNVAYVPNWDKRWKVSLAATNVTNVAGINSKYTDPYGTAQTSVQYIAPMQVIGTIAVSF